MTQRGLKVTPILPYPGCPFYVKINGGRYRCEGRAHHPGSHFNNLFRVEWGMEEPDDS